MRWILIALLLCAGMVPALARTHQTLTERFDAANTTHDGHLTAEQARTSMPAVARDFAAIDTGNRGYVTLDDIKGHSHAMRIARRAARQDAQPSVAKAGSAASTGVAGAPTAKAE